MTWSAAACNLNFSARKLKSTLTTVRHSSPTLTHNIISSVDYRCKQVHSTFTIPSMNTVHLHQKFQHIEYFSNHESLSGKKSAAASMIKFNHMNVYCTHTEHITNERQTERKDIHTNAIPSWPEVKRIRQQNKRPMTMEGAYSNPMTVTWTKTQLHHSFTTRD